MKNQGFDLGKLCCITFRPDFVIPHIVVRWRLREVVGFQFDLHIPNSYYNILTILNISDTGKKYDIS